MSPKPLQLQLFYPPRSSKLFKTKDKNDEICTQTNKLDPRDRAFHDWYRFVLSFPPHLVRKYIQEFELDNRHTLLDPFPHFAASVKTDWATDADTLRGRWHTIPIEDYIVYGGEQT